MTVSDDTEAVAMAKSIGVELPETAPASSAPDTLVGRLPSHAITPSGER